MDFWNNASTGVKILIVAVIVAALIGVFYLLSGGLGAQPEPTATPIASQPTLAPTNTPVPTPKPAEPPVAVISGPTQALVGESITLSAADSRAAEGSQITGSRWDLGDGMQSTNKEVTHAYQKAGKYEVSLTVTDNNGLENTSTIKIMVEEPTPTAQPTDTPEPEPTSTPINPSDALKGRKWVLLNTLPDTQINVTFLRGRVAGFAGCNDFTGKYQTGSDGSIQISELKAGRKTCDQPIMNQEQAFLTTLDKVTSFQIQGAQGQQLILSTPTGVLLQFQTQD